DGGGVRGYASLLMLRKLMAFVAELEMKLAGNSLWTGYLPCHYFDYIFGTSTGGLNAIMLGRLRMSVDECIEKYPEMAKNIF
ncbi:uncharacterized protein K441DRAFT_463573, partial [Cenococcum geophilum 1.58]|uniref:uncharacterized protein n=1 Tax=Cenococcum geophilum 1.58 TaxID=794803 RepID=UPI00358FF8B2